MVYCYVFALHQFASPTLHQRAQLSHHHTASYELGGRAEGGLYSVDLLLLCRLFKHAPKHTDTPSTATCSTHKLEEFGKSKMCS